LKPLLKTDLCTFIFSPLDSEGWRHSQAKIHRRPNQKPNGRLTYRRIGKRYTKDSYARAIARAHKKADRWAKGGRVCDDVEVIIPAWHPHQLRHNIATKLRKEYGLDASRIVLGHTSNSSVTAIYAEADMEKGKQIMAKVG
jgi:integrase